MPPYRIATRNTWGGGGLPAPSPPSPPSPLSLNEEESNEDEEVEEDEEDEDEAEEEEWGEEDATGDDCTGAGSADNASRIASKWRLSPWSTTHRIRVHRGVSDGALRLWFPGNGAPWPCPSLLSLSWSVSLKPSSPFFAPPHALSPAARVLRGEPPPSPSPCSPPCESKGEDGEEEEEEEAEAEEEGV